jgi:[protein-PII] uridylyltransferase
MQEPNIKNGCGGLRDVQSLRWMAFFKHRTLSLAEMEARDFLNSAERKQLESAYDFLLAVRNEMHDLSTSPKMTHEVLLKALQPAVALRLGYTDRSPSRRLEQFMRHLYKHMRNIYLITRTLEERLALLPRPQRMPGLRRLGRSFRRLKKTPRSSAVQIHRRPDSPTSPRVFKDQPRRLMRVFLHANSARAASRSGPDDRRDLALNGWKLSQ